MGFGWQLHNHNWAIRTIIIVELSIIAKLMGKEGRDSLACIVKGRVDRRDDEGMKGYYDYCSGWDWNKEGKEKKEEE